MAGRGGKRRGAGRPPGSLNKKTVALQRALVEAVGPMRAAEVPRGKAAVAVLSDVMNFCYEMAIKHQPVGWNPLADEKLFLEYTRITCAIAIKIAPYQCRKLRPIKVRVV